VVEPLGDAMDVSCSTPKHANIVARVPAHSGLAGGQTALLVPDANAAHFFEPGEFGASLADPV